MGFKSVWIFAAYLVTVSAIAERMDVHTHDLLISKLEATRASLSDSANEKQAVILRLADLYSDRARLMVLAQQDGSTDRNKAIALYRQVEKSLALSTRGPVLIQLAHLELLGNQLKAAERNLNEASQAKKYGASIAAKAESQLGEIAFRQAQFKKAEKHFKNALKTPQEINSSFVTYRLAWAQLNQGQQNVAIQTLKSLLSDPDAMADKSFHDDLTRDYVVFLARGPVGDSEITSVITYSPDELRRENLYALANELERLGKKSSAALAWQAYEVESGGNHKDSIETQIRVAQLKWDMNDKKAAIVEFERATSMWKDKGCKDQSICEELNKRFKNFVTTWNRTEKDQPSDLCLKSYQLYLNAFPNDAEMHFKAGTIAEQRKNYGEAAQLYAQTALVIAKDSKKYPEALFEAASVKFIEMAELSKDKNLRLSAYDSFLNYHSQKPKALEVRYQKAQVTYELGQSESAFQQFLSVAKTQDEKQRPLRIKAADLSLDALANKKDHGRIYETSKELHSLFKERRSEFAKIQRQAALKIALASLSEEAKANHSEQKRARTLIQESLQDGISIQERVEHLKAAILISERLKDVDQIEKDSIALSRIKGLNPKDQKFAIDRLIWVAELKLDFKTAYQLSQKSGLSHLNADDQQLRLAMLAELAQLDATSHYRKALKLTRSRAKADGIRATLIRTAKNPWSALQEFSAEIMRNRNMASSLVIEAYGKTGQRDKAERLLKKMGITTSSLSALFRQQDILKRWQIADNKVRQQKINSRSEVVLQKSIAQRMDALSKVEQIGNEALRSKDWLAQLAVLNTIERENQRFYDELIKLPVPKRLKDPQSIRQYQKILNDKAQVFQSRSEQARSKKNEFLKQNNVFNEFASTLEKASGHNKTLISTNLRIVSQQTDVKTRNKIQDALSTNSELPSQQELKSAQNEVKQDPFDLKALSELKQIAERRGQSTMVAYIDARMDQLKKDKRQ